MIWKLIWKLKWKLIGFFQSHIRIVVTKRTVLIAKVFIHDEHFIWSLHLKEIQNFSNKKSGKLIWKLVWKFIWKLMNIDMKIDRILSKSYPFRCHKKDSTDHQSIHSWWVLNLKSKPERKCKILVIIKVDRNKFKQKGQYWSPKYSFMMSTKFEV